MSARLTSIAPYVSRKETAVYATDRITGIMIRCKVFIDNISRIRIFHHSVKINLDELATLRIRAFDDEENVFSSLVGLKFLWQLKPKPSDATNIRYLIHVPLKETPLSDCGGFCGNLDFQIDLEDRGFGSDLYVVKGTGIGHVIVSVKMLEPQLEHVTDSIVLTVAEAMSLDPPSPVFVTVGALIYYTLRVTRSKTEVVDLPSPNHRWSVINSSVADVDSEKGWVYALDLGTTNIVVEDTRLSGHVQTSSLHVVIPDHLSLYLLPVSSDFSGFNISEETKPVSSSVIWYVSPEHVYFIHMSAFSQGPDAEEIYITENNDVKLESSTDEYWGIYSVADVVPTTYDRRVYRLLKPTSEGRGVLSAYLTYYSNEEKEWMVLKAFQDVIVCSRVKVIIQKEDEFSQILRLPWAPGVCQEVELKATGGCVRNLEDYIWFSSDETVVSVSTSGVLRVKMPGQAVIKVVSIYDSINYDEVVVQVSTPSSMVMLENFPVEVVTGTKFHVTVALKTLDGEYFSRCDSFNSFVRWEVFSESETFKVLNESLDLNERLSDIQGSELQSYQCARTYLYASTAGHAVLQATLSINLLSHLTLTDEPITLNTTSTLAAYSPLVVHQAESGNKFGGYWIDLTRMHADVNNAEIRLHDLYLVPGSRMSILLLGGPERWNQQIEYIESVEITSEQGQSITNGVLVQQTPSSGGRLYSILCQTVGHFKLHFSRGNLVGDGHPLPAVAYVELPIICSFPSSISLIANEPVNRPNIIEAAVKADRSPDRIRSSPVIVANGRTIRIAAVGIHTTGRSFANSSSLLLRWELNSCEGLAHWNETESFEESSWERFLVLHDASGQCTVRATVVGFPRAMASHLFEKEYLLGSTDNIITDAIHLQLVSTLRIIPEFALLVFDPEAKVNLSVTGGTRFLDAVTNDTQVAELSQPQEELSYIMLSARGLGDAIVTVWDVGLSPPAVASAVVKVANIDWIKIVSEEEISLMEGSKKDFKILAGTHDGLVFDSSQYMFMNIHVHLNDGILEVVNMNSSGRLSGWIISIPHFTIRAALSGTTSLYVCATQRYGHEIFSQVIKVEVYKPLCLHPEYVYLTPGASYMLTVEGGPKVASVKYTSMHEYTATIQGSSGRLSAISTGNATIRATAFGSDGTLICEAYGKVQVGIPSAMFLNLQSDRLCIGCKMPVFPSFHEGNLFSFYEICYDYKWTAEKEVVSYQKSAYLYSDVDEIWLSCAQGVDNPCLPDDGSAFINVLAGRYEGKTEVSVSFSCNFVSSGIARVVSYNASKTLTVVADPPLALGIPITWLLPPFYTTSNLLPGSADWYMKLKSRDRKKSISYSLLRAYGRGDISKQDAIAIDGRRIKTKEKNELDCIQAKDQTTSRTEIASCVRVAEVAQVRIVKTGSLYHVAYLALNAELELPIGYCDDLGYYFLEAHGVVQLDVETNFPDVVSVRMPNNDNNNKSHVGYENVFLEARGPGKALVMVTINHNPKKAVYIMVFVGVDVYPRNRIVDVDHELNFTTIGDGQPQTEINVSFVHHGNNKSTKPAVARSSLGTWSAVVTIFVVLICTVIVFLRLLERPRDRADAPSSMLGTPIASRSTARASAPSVHSTPLSSSAAAANANQSSPRTPSQEFAEYVRRTIDETPYYKRSGGRRRFDPQYTY